MKRLLYAVLGLTVAVLGIAGLSLVLVGRDLYAARGALDASGPELSAATLEQARVRLDRAARRLDWFLYDAVRFVPVVGHNLDALETATDASMPVLSAAHDLALVAEDLEGTGILEEGRVDLDVIDDLRGLVEAQEIALKRLAVSAAEATNGALFPPVWDALDEMRRRATELHSSLAQTAAFVEIAGPVLGAEDERVYLVVLLNNAELRGAGGIPSALGLVRAEGGEVEVGRFRYYAELSRATPRTRVPAPRDFRRRFGEYAADTTLWVNTTFSPDLPDVALVARRLYEVGTGLRVDGVLFADPRGIAALLPEDAEIAVPGTDDVVSAADLPEFVYSDAYAVLGGATRVRRDALVAVGRSGLSLALERGLRSREEFERAASAVAGGHLSFVPLLPDELARLDEAGAIRDLEPPDGASLLVTVQNTGGDKLDYWVERSIDHRCAVRSPTRAVCATTVGLANEAPAGLPRYVAPAPSYGLTRSFLEVYVPETASIERVEVDGAPEGFLHGSQDGYVAIGRVLELGPGETRTMRVDYELAIDGQLRMEVLPQPLARDAALYVEIDVPQGWRLTGPPTGETTLRGRLSWTAAPPAPKTGIPRSWDALVRWWNEPVF